MKKQVKNATSGLLLQLIVMLFGFVLPKMMLEAYGSSTYGLVNSLAKFLSYVTLFEAGIGTVVRASIYKKFANHDQIGINRILKATSIFYRKLCIGYIAYGLVLAFVYPVYINDTFDVFFTASLLLIIMINQTMQYTFSMAHSMYLRADGRLYVINTLTIVTTTLNAVASIVLIQLGAPIHVVKLFSAGVFLLRPAFFTYYVRKHYNIDFNCEPDHEALSQRKYGVIHHFAYFLHSNADVVVITLFSTLSNVSVYAVYYMVANSMTKITEAIISGGEAWYGRYMAKHGNESTAEKFHFFTMISFTVAIVLFFVAGSMLMPFIHLYTQNITDTNYIFPVFGYTLLLAELLYCLRMPFNSIIVAAGHFKQTQTSAIVEVVVNVVLSVSLIQAFGLWGVAVATAAAMLYRTVYYIYYLSKYILRISFWEYLIRLGLVVGFIILAVFAKTLVLPFADSIILWMMHSVICGICGIALAIGFNMICFPTQCKTIWTLLLNKKNKND